MRNKTKLIKTKKCFLNLDVVLSFNDFRKVRKIGKTSAQISSNIKILQNLQFY